MLTKEYHSMSYAYPAGWVEDLKGSAIPWFCTFNFFFFFF